MVIQAAANLGTQPVGAGQFLGSPPVTTITLS
jgi:hypothetical protein